MAAGSDERGAEFSPSWDRAGRRVAFLFRPEGSVLLESAKQLWVADVQTGTIERVVQLAENDTRSLFDPSWSPDGEWLAFWMLDEDGSRDVYVVRADDQGPQQPVRVTRNAGISGSIYWKAGLLLPTP